jgi:hypothetical protein
MCGRKIEANEKFSGVLHNEEYRNLGLRISFRIVKIVK